MAESRHTLTVCLVYNSKDHHARWVTPATAVRLEEMYDFIEQIPENHKFYDDYAAIAGIKPEITISER